MRGVKSSGHRDEADARRARGGNDCFLFHRVLCSPGPVRWAFLSPRTCSRVCFVRLLSVRGQPPYLSLGCFPQLSRPTRVFAVPVDSSLATGVLRHSCSKAPAAGEGTDPEALWSDQVGPGLEGYILGQDRSISNVGPR